MKLKAIQEMKLEDRKLWLREKWGVEIRSSNTESTWYPMDILRKGQPIGRIVCEHSRVILNLPRIGDLDHDKAFGADALEIWGYQGHQIGPAADADAERINALIYYFVGVWAEQRSS